MRNHYTAYIKCLLFTCAALFSAAAAKAQDIIELADGRSMRGIIVGFNTRQINLTDDGGENTFIKTADVRRLFWNGSNYVKKTIFTNNRAIDVLVKELVTGKINLYEFGGKTAYTFPQEKKKRNMPDISIGVGGGSGFGIAPGIGVGFGGRQPENAASSLAVEYFIEKPGTKGMQYLPYKPNASLQQSATVKNMLMPYVADKPGAAAQLNALELITKSDLLQLLKFYNAP